MASDQYRNPLQPIVDRWKRVFETARKDRNQKFDKWADEAMNFFDGPVNWMWESVRGAKTSLSAQQTGSAHSGFLASDAHLPEFEMSVNRLFEAVAMFGPVLYHQNPTIAVTPRDYPEVSIDTFYGANPQAVEILSMVPQVEAGLVQDQGAIQAVQTVYQIYEQALEQGRKKKVIDRDHAMILESLSNYIQQEGSKQDEARLAITEAIITGLGLFRISMETPPAGGPKMPVSRYLSNKDILVDPDANYWRDVTWIAIRQIKPVNVVEQEFARYGLQPGYLKGKYARKAATDNKGSRQRNGDKKVTGVTHDLVEYWEVYSKNGAGQHLKMNDKDKDVPGLEFLGDYVKLAISEDCPFPLNMPPQLLATGDEELLLEAAEWEVPFWDDHWSDGGWPIVRLTFYNKPGEVWPISMVKPCIGELRFVNWCMSFIADKVSAGSQIYVGVMKEAAENIRSQLQGGRGPFTVLEIQRITGKKLDDFISFMQAPSFSMDIWKMVAEVNEQIDKRLGLTELLYGISNRQMRSAAEAQYRQQNINVRPDDMASRVEDWLSLTATREIQAFRYLGSFEDVMPVIGPTAAQVFAEQILTDEVSRITRDFSFRVEAGTARKPNKDTQIAQLTDIGQYILPVIQQAMMSGVTRPFNAYMEAVGRAMDIEVEEFLLGDAEQQMLVAMNAPPPTPAEIEQDGSQSKSGQDS